FFFQAEDGIRDRTVTGVQTCSSDLRTVVTRTEADDEPLYFRLACIRCGDAQLRSQDHGLEPSTANPAAARDVVEPGHSPFHAEQIGSASRRPGAPIPVIASAVRTIG